MDLAEQVGLLISDVGSALEKNSVCSAWILVTEWVDGQGDVWVEEHRITDLPQWRRQGLLYYLLNSVEPVYQLEDYDE
jgi:hypothetical protein